MSKSKKSRFTEIINLGPQPISNRYSKKPSGYCAKVKLILEQSNQTGIIRLKNPNNPKNLKPIVDWISYNEPEPHLDDFVKSVINKFYKNKKIVVGGISSKDDSTLDRFKSLGHKVWRIDEKKDLNLDKRSGIETIQDKLNTRKISKLNDRYPLADFLVVRHIWEHVYNQKEFAKTLKNLIKEDGIIFIEIPDCRKLLKSNDITMVWEEHLFYYTSHTIRTSLNNQNLRVVHQKVAHYPTENSILLCLKNKKGKNKKKKSEKFLREELRIGKEFGKKYRYNKKYLKLLFDETLKKSIKIIIFGGGHLALAFIAYYDLYDYVECVMDDDKNKQNLYMPGTSIKIKSSDNLISYKNALILMTVNLTSENKLKNIIEKKTEGNISIKSIFPLSKYSIFTKINEKKY